MHFSWSTAGFAFHCAPSLALSLRKSKKPVPRPLSLNNIFFSDAVGNCDEELDEVLVGEESDVGNQETKDRELEEDGYIWTMDNVDSKSLLFFWVAVSNFFFR